MNKVLGGFWVVELQSLAMEMDSEQMKRATSALDVLLLMEPALTHSRHTQYGHTHTHTSICTCAYTHTLVVKLPSLCDKSK